MLNTYTDLLSIAENEARLMGANVNVALKEVLHYDILFALSESSLGNRLVFQGGTSLRLCHQGNRYSEDLDFVSGTLGIAEHMERFKEILRQTVERRYGLEVAFKDPKPVRLNDSGVSVQRWAATVKIDRQCRSQSSSHKINIEVADVPSHDNEPMFIQRHYDGLAPGHSHILLRTSTLREIMADKVLAAANRSHLKPRDIWDLNWLSRRQTPVDMAMVRDKLKDYREEEVFDPNLDRCLDRLHDPAYVAVFNQEMSRFLNQKMKSVLTDTPDFTPKLLSSVAQQLERVREARLNNRPIINSDELSL